MSTIWNRVSAEAKYLEELRGMLLLTILAAKKSIELQTFAKEGFWGSLPNPKRPQHPETRLGFRARRELFLCPMASLLGALFQSSYIIRGQRKSRYGVRGFRV